MKWKKKGLIYGPSGRSQWAQNSALQPTPHLINDELLRVFVGFRDAAGVSRIGFVDVDPSNPSEVYNVSTEPAIDIGSPGDFDDNGVAPCAVVDLGGELRLYYAGYQLGTKVRFTVFSGLAVSSDGGLSFKKHSCVPVLDRTSDERHFRVIHTVLVERDKWKVWYGGGSSWSSDDRPVPRYDIRYLESPDGMTFPSQGRVCIPTEENEHRVARPYVVHDGDVYRMFFAAQKRGESYRLGYAESQDGFNWNRKDAELGLDVSPDGWDSTMISYPSVVKYRDNTYLFYTGNDMGREGFGYAVLES